MYENWKIDPKSVHASWNAYFENVSKGVTPAYVEPPVVGPGAIVSPPTYSGPAATPKEIQDHLKVYQLISAYQLKGHEIADFDPLSITNVNE